jgi:hypothetical protein
MKTEFEGRTVNLPDIHIVGAAKSGSSSLYAYLSLHPKIYAPELKEPRTLLFLDGMPENPPASLLLTPPLPLEEYVNLYSPAGNRKALEGSIIYLANYEIVIPNIRRLYKNPEEIYFLAILRDPVERAFSQYKASLRNGLTTLPFREDYPNHVRGSLYYEQIRAFMRGFPRVKVCLFEDLKNDAQGLIDDLCDFLEIQRFSPSFERHNVTKRPPLNRALYSISQKKSPLSSRFPIIGKLPLSIRNAPFRLLDRLNQAKEVDRDEKTMAELRAYFREDVLKLQELIGRDLSAWL